MPVSTAVPAAITTVPGVLVDGNGKITTVITGRGQGVIDPQGVTFRQLLSVKGLHPGDTAPSMADQQLAATDPGMARIGEDAIAALLSKGTISKGDLAQAAWDKVNARRVLRNQGTL